MNLIQIFLKNTLFSVAFVALGWLYLQKPAAVALGSFVAFLQDPTTAIIVASISLALVSLEWLS